MASETPTFSFLDRLRQRYVQRRVDAEGEDTPPRRGLIVTVCFLLSCVLWFTFTMQEVYPVSIAFPTQVTDVSPDLALTELPPEQVEVVVQGEGYQLLQLYYDRPVITLNATSGVIDVRNAVGLDLPNNINLVSVRPSEVRLDKDLRIERKVPVRSRVRISTPPTHDFVFGPDVEPDSVVVRGARSVVNRIPYWPTEPRVRRDMKDSLRLTVPLQDTLRGLVEHYPQAVTVRAVAEQFTEAERQLDVTVRAVPVEEELRLEPSSVQVRFRIPLSQYREAQEAGDFYADVTYQQIRDDATGRVKPVIHLPPSLDIRDVQVIPSSLRYFHIMVRE